MLSLLCCDFQTSLAASGFQSLCVSFSVLRCCPNPSTDICDLVVLRTLSRGAAQLMPRSKRPWKCAPTSLSYFNCDTMDLWVFRHMLLIIKVMTNFKLAFAMYLMCECSFSLALNNRNSKPQMSIKPGVSFMIGKSSTFQLQPYLINVLNTRQNPV